MRSHDVKRKGGSNETDSPASNAGSDEILLSLLAATPATIAADALDDHTVPGHAKSFLGSHVITNGDERVTLKLNQFSTLRAVQMIVLRVAVIQFVDRTAIELKTLQQSCINEFSQGPVNRGGADVILFPSTGQTVDQLIGVEVIVLLKDRLDQEPPLRGLPQAAGL